MHDLKSEDNLMIVIAAAIIALASFLLFGIAGLRTVIGMILFMFLPFYLVLNNFVISQPEKIAFSFFAGITLFSSFVYWLGFLIPFRVSVLAVFALLIIAAYSIKRFRKISVS